MEQGTIVLCCFNFIEFWKRLFYIANLPQQIMCIFQIVWFLNLIASFYCPFFTPHSGITLEKVINGGGMEFMEKYFIEIPKNVG